jgi:hypothetical protein
VFEEQPQRVANSHAEVKTSGKRAQLPGEQQVSYLTSPRHSGPVQKDQLADSDSCVRCGRRIDIDSDEYDDGEATPDGTG